MNTGCLIGILILVYELIPTNHWVVSNHPIPPDPHHPYIHPPRDSQRPPGDSRCPDGHQTAIHIGQFQIHLREPPLSSICEANVKPLKGIVCLYLVI